MQWTMHLTHFGIESSNLIGVAFESILSDVELDVLFVDV